MALKALAFKACGFVQYALDSAPLRKEETPMLVPCLALLEEDRDRALFLEVYQAHSQLLLRVAGRVLGGDRMLAEEAAQEAWIKVCTHFESFLSVPCHKRRAWLVIVMRPEQSQTP